MDEDFKEFKEVEEALGKAQDFWYAFIQWLGPYGKMAWDTLTLIIGLGGTLLVSISVQPNPQHLGFVADSRGVFYEVASTSSASVFAVVDDFQFYAGMALLVLAFMLQITQIWREDLFSSLKKLYKKLSSRWQDETIATPE